MNLIYVGKKIKLKDYPKGDKNEYVIVKAFYPDDKIWITNFNMPYCGTISKTVTLKELEDLSGLKFKYK